jgi:hypothetical protein
MSRSATLTWLGDAGLTDDKLVFGSALAFEGNFTLIKILFLS